MPHLSLHEALVLSLGVDPEKITSDDVEQMQKEPQRNKMLPAVNYLLKRRELFRRSFRAGYNGFYPRSPKDLRDWFASISLEGHPDFQAALDQRVPQSEVVKPATD